MLKEVGKSPLVLLFEDRTYLLNNIEFRLSLRLCITTDVVGEAVV